MDKITTSVKMRACALLFLTGLSPMALAVDPAPTTTTRTCADAAATLEGYNRALTATPPNDTLVAEYRRQLDAINSCNTANGGTTTATCSNADTQFSEAGKAFTAACAKANLGTGDDMTACGKKMAKCDVAQDASLSTDVNKPYDTSSAAKRRMRDCPAYAGLDLKTLREQVEQQRKAVSELEKEIVPLRKELLAGKTSANKAKSDARKEAINDQKEHSKELRDIKLAADEKNKAAMDKLNQLRAEMTGKYAAISAAKLNQVAAGATLEETKTKIKLNCYTTASAQINEQQRNAMAQMSMGAFNRGGQEQLLQNVGMSSRGAWQKLASKYYDWCITAQPAVESFKSANAAYNLSISQLEQTVRNLNAEIDGLQAQMTQVASPVPCGQASPVGPGAESDVCRAQRQRSEDWMESENNYQSSQAALNDEMVQNAKDAAEASGLTQTQLDSRSKDVENEHTRLTNLQEYYAMKYNASGGRETEQGALAEAFARYSDLKAVAHSAKECSVPGRCEDPLTPGRSICTPQVDDAAKFARDFLRNIGDPDYAPTATPAEPVTAVPTTPAIHGGDDHDPADTAD